MRNKTYNSLLHVCKQNSGHVLSGLCISKLGPIIMCQTLVTVKHNRGHVLSG